MSSTQRTQFPDPCQDPYTRAPNLFFEEYSDLDPYTWKVLGMMIRKTYGWHKSEMQISYAALARMTKISDKQVKRSVEILVAEKVIERTHNFGPDNSKKANTYRIIFKRENESPTDPTPGSNRPYPPGPTDPTPLGPTDPSFKESSSLKEKNKQTETREAVHEPDLPPPVCLFSSDEEKGKEQVKPAVNGSTFVDAAKLAAASITPQKPNCLIPPNPQAHTPEPKLPKITPSSFIALDEHGNPVMRQHKYDPKCLTMTPTQKALYSRFMALRTMDHGDNGVDVSWVANAVTSGVYDAFTLNQAIVTYLNDAEKYTMKGERIGNVGGYLNMLLRNPRQSSNPLVGKNKQWWDNQKTDIHPKLYSEDKGGVTFPSIHSDISYSMEHSAFKELLACYFLKLTQRPRKNDYA